MLGNVHARKLALRRKAQHPQCFQGVHHGQRGDEGRSANAGAAHGLRDQLAGAAAVKEAGHHAGRRVGAGRTGRAVLARREQAQAKGAPNATNAMHRHGTHGIVDAQVLEEIESEYADDAGHAAEDERARRRYPIAGASRPNPQEIRSP